VPKDCHTEVAYRFNGHFECTGGHRWWNNGDISFPAESRKSEKAGAYRTLGGYNIAHTGVIYGLTNHNINLGARRLLNTMVPDYGLEAPADYDARLRASQKAWFETNGPSLRDDFRQFGDFPWVDMTAEAYFLTLLPHAKRLLREHDYEELVKFGEQRKIGWLEVVIWKLKLDEIAKVGKWPRYIVNMGTKASLQTVPFGCSWKAHMDGKELRFPGGACVFLASPSPERVMEEVQKVWDSTEPFRLLYFSDDGLLSINTVDGEKMVFNVDFATNDLTKSLELILNALDCAQCPEDIRRAVIAQIFASIEIWDSEHRCKISLKALLAYLQSGIGITGNINNHAQCAAGKELSMSHSSIRCAHDVVLMYERIGHKVSMERCLIIEDCQFLKMSPVVSEGRYVMVLNPGVIFRASGQNRGDYLGSRDEGVTVRVQRAQRGLMDGLLAGISNVGLSYLRPRGEDAGGGWESYVPDSIRRISFTKKYPVKSEDLYRRYRLTGADIEELEEGMRGLGVGRTLYSPAAAKVLKKDYGLSVPLE